MPPRRGPSWPSEEIEYLEEILAEYERFVENIGANELSAPLLMYYRDELQDSLTSLEQRVPLQPYWAQTVELDQQVKDRAAEIVAEIGWENYRIQRGARKPPRAYWWWYLDAGLAPPERPNVVKSWWEWLKKP